MSVHIAKHKIKIDKLDENFNIHHALSYSHLAIVLYPIVVAIEITGVN